MIEFTLPIRTYSALNERIHWAVRAKRVKSERMITSLLMPRTVKMPPFPQPLTVTLTRIAPRALDGDNWQGGAKGHGSHQRLPVREGCGHFGGRRGNAMTTTTQEILAEFPGSPIPPVCPASQ